MKRLDEIRARYEAATEEPWIHDGRGKIYYGGDDILYVDGLGDATMEPGTADCLSSWWYYYFLINQKPDQIVWLTESR